MSAWQDELIAWDEQAFLDLNVWLHEVVGTHVDIGSALRAANEFGTGWVLVLAGIVIFSLERRGGWAWRRILELGVGSLVAGGASSLLKELTARPRPQLTLTGAFETGTVYIGFGESVLGMSWPSGHTTTAFVTATILSAWAQAIPERWRRRAVQTALYGIAALTGVARVYGAAHYPLDVLSGAILGITLGTLVVVVFRRVWPLPSREPTPN